MSAVVITSIFASQLFLESGKFDLRLLNRSLANTSIALLGIVLLLGTLSRLYNVVDRWLNYRKELGIFALFTGALHVYLVMFPLARSGPFGFYLARPLPALAGLAGLIIMFFLFTISFNIIKNSLGAARWWRYQYTGVRLAGIAVLIHVGILRYQVWLTSIHSNASAQYIAPNLFVGLFAIYVLLVRFSEPVGRTMARILVFLWTLALVATLVWLIFR